MVYAHNDVTGDGVIAFNDDRGTESTQRLVLALMYASGNNMTIMSYQSVIVPSDIYYDSTNGGTILGKYYILSNYVLGYVNYANGTGAVIMIRVSTTYQNSYLHLSCVYLFIIIDQYRYGIDNR